jgi:hypothetical protein
MNLPSNCLDLNIFRWGDGMRGKMNVGTAATGGRGAQLRSHFEKFSRSSSPETGNLASHHNFIATVEERRFSAA